MTTSKRPPLSDTQAKVMAYLVKFLELNDQLPTTAKIAEDFGWASPNSANIHLKAMEKKGWLARNELHNLMLADRPAMAPVVISVDHARGTDVTVWWPRVKANVPDGIVEKGA